MFWNLFKYYKSSQVTHLGRSVPKLSSTFTQSHLVLSPWISSLVRTCLQSSVPPTTRRSFVKPTCFLKQQALVRGLAERWGSARLRRGRAPPAAAPARAPNHPSSSRAQSSDAAAQPARQTCVITVRPFHSSCSSAAQPFSCLNRL